MSKRGHNPVRAVRWGAVVMLAGAGTLAALVVSEWPLTGEMIARQATTGARRTPMPGAWPVQAAFFSLEEPDPSRPVWPGLVAAGSAEETRRDVQSHNDNSPSTMKHPRHIDDAETAPKRIGLNDYIEWWKTTPYGKVVEQAIAHDPRAGTTTYAAPPLDFATSIARYNMGVVPNNGAFEPADGGGANAVKADDFSVRFDALGDGLLNNSLGLSTVGGVRSANLFDQVERERFTADLSSAIDDGTGIKWTDRSMLRARALGETPGTVRDYLDLRLEQVWRIGSASSLSVGWQHLRGITSNDFPEPTIKQDAILLELKIGF